MGRKWGKRGPRKPEAKAFREARGQLRRAGSANWQTQASEEERQRQALQAGEAGSSAPRKAEDAGSSAPQPEAKTGDADRPVPRQEQAKGPNEPEDKKEPKEKKRKRDLRTLTKEELEVLWTEI